MRVIPQSSSELVRAKPTWRPHSGATVHRPRAVLHRNDPEPLTVLNVIARADSNGISDTSSPNQSAWNGQGVVFRYEHYKPRHNESFEGAFFIPARQKSHVTTASPR